MRALDERRRRLVNLHLLLIPLLTLAFPPALAGGIVRPGEASPVGDLRAGRGPGSSVEVLFTPACNATDHVAYWGTGSPAGGPVWSGSACALGTSGTASFDPGQPEPGELLSFVVVGQDATYEGSYGLASDGSERAEASGVGACDRPRTTQATCISVDMARSVEGVRSQSGFLHSLRANAPPDATVVPLAPAQWRRHDFSDHDRVTGLGARFQVVLSDMWGYPNGTWGWPFQRWSIYEAWVRTVAQANRDKAAIWDVWNEPNHPYFWGGTIEQFFETYRRTYAILRQELGPDALIGGPSYTFYDRPLLVRFLDSCRTGGCEVNFLTWHELGGDIVGIPGRLRDARSSFVEHPDYAALDIREIQVNEIVGSGQMHAPGAIVGFFQALEAGGSDGACKACWGESNGIANCDNDTLDGLLTPTTFLTRSAWWAYKAYADGVSARVASRNQDPGVVALASSTSGSPGAAQVLIGAFQTGGSPSTTAVGVTIGNVDRLPYLAGATAVRVIVDRMPATGEAPLAAPLPVRDEVHPLVRGGLMLRLDGVGLNEAWRITLMAP